MNEEIGAANRVLSTFLTVAGTKTMTLIRMAVREGKDIWIKITKALNDLVQKTKSSHRSSGSHTQ